MGFCTWPHYETNAVVNPKPSIPLWAFMCVFFFSCCQSQSDRGNCDSDLDTRNRSRCELRKRSDDDASASNQNKRERKHFNRLSCILRMDDHLVFGVHLRVRVSGACGSSRTRDRSMRWAYSGAYVCSCERNNIAESHESRMRIDHNLTLHAVSSSNNLVDWCTAYCRDAN